MSNTMTPMTLSSPTGNFTTTVFNLTTSLVVTNPAPAYPFPNRASVIASCIFYTLIAVLSVFGNILVIAAFFINDKLRTVTNYFVVGLAAADILVGAVSVPLWMFFITNYLVSLSNPTLLIVYTTFDMFAGISSILHLMAISMERYFCVGWAIKHRNTPRYVYYIGLFLVWFISAMVACIRLMAPSIKDTDLTLLIFVVFFLMPLVVIVISYAAIWKIAMTRMSNNPTKRSLKREIRTAITIAFVIGFFFLSWSPFFIIQTVILFCAQSCPYNWSLTLFFKFLHYSNSAINPVVYGVRIPEFRKTFKFILKRFYGPCLAIARR